MMEILGHLFGQAVGGLRPQDPFFVEMRDWSAQLAGQALARWKAVMSSGIPCACENTCQRPAIGGCVICGHPTCLAHALVAGSAEVACYRCIREAATRTGRAPHAPPGPVPGPQAAPPTNEEIRKRYLKTLNLKPGASQDEIKVMFRFLAHKHHPDRATPGRKAAAERKMKEITAAYHWLTAHATEAAA